MESEMPPSLQTCSFIEVTSPCASASEQHIPVYQLSCYPSTLWMKLQGSNRMVFIWGTQYLCSNSVKDWVHFSFFLKPVIQNKRMDNWSLDILTLQSVAGTDDFKYPKEQLQVKSKFKWCISEPSRILMSNPLKKPSCLPSYMIVLIFNWDFQSLITSLWRYFWRITFLKIGIWFGNTYPGVHRGSRLHFLLAFLLNHLYQKKIFPSCIEHWDMS